VPYIIGAVVLVILIGLWFVISHNSFITLITKVEEAFSTIDVYLKKRYDLIPNLVATVKGYASHEKETLDAVITARSKAMSSAPEQKSQTEGELSQALGRLLMLGEQYPNLKADTQFMQLQQELSNIESEIERARRYYNGIVAQLNRKVRQIPSCFVASAFHFTERPYFELEDAAQREAVKVEF
jgi:LemA protein